MATSGEALDDDEEEVEEELTETSSITGVLSVQRRPLDEATRSLEMNPQKVSLLNEILDLTPLKGNDSTAHTTPPITEQDANKDLALDGISRKDTEQSSPSHAPNTSPEDNMEPLSTRIDQQNMKKSSPSHGCCSNTKSTPPSARRQNISHEDNLNLVSARLMHQGTKDSSPSHACCSTSYTPPSSPTSPQSTSSEDKMNAVSSGIWPQELESYGSRACCSTTKPVRRYHDHNDDVKQVTDSKEDEQQEDVPNVYTLFPQLLTHYPVEKDILDKRMSTTEVTRTLANMHAKADFSHMKQASRLIPPQRIWLDALEEGLDEADEEEEVKEDSDESESDDESVVDVLVDKVDLD